MNRELPSLGVPERSVYKFLDYIDIYVVNPKTLIELGARDCTETAVLSKNLPSTQIYSFECNPATLPLCRSVSGQLDNVKLIEEAVSDKTGKIDFFAIDPKKTKTTWQDGNPGASSLLKASGKYPAEDYVQKKVEVDSTRLDDFMAKEQIAMLDVLWMDIQGAELMALNSLGGEINNIKLVHTEVEFFEIYKDQPLFEDIYGLLRGKGFILGGFTSFGEYSADAVFINKRIFPRAASIKAILNERTLLKKVQAHASK